MLEVYDCHSFLKDLISLDIGDFRDHGRDLVTFALLLRTSSSIMR